MAKTLKFGNGTWATKKGSTLAYNDEGGNFKPLPFTYTGAGKGTRVNKEGLIEVVENDRPRIDYTDSEDGVFLLEKAATNLVTYSEDFSNSYWAKANISILSNEAISPDGSLNADKLVESNNNGIHTAYKSPLLTQNSIISIFAKAGERSRIALGSSSTNYFAIFDLSLGYVIDSSDGSISNGTIESVGNGWYRCSCLFTYQGANRSLSYAIVNDDNAHTYQGDGTSGIYVWGAQLESGNLSSYIPTEGNPQTRVQETASGSGNSGVFNDSEGVLMAEISSIADGENRQLGISDGSSSDRVIITLRPDNETVRFYYEGTTGGSTQIDSSSYNFNNTLKIAAKYKSQDIALWVNGFEVGTSTSAITTSGLNVLDFYNVANSALAMYGNTKQIQYFDSALTDIELETLTSYRSWEAMVKELNLNIIHNE